MPRNSIRGYGPKSKVLFVPCSFLSLTNLTLLAGILRPPPAPGLGPKRQYSLLTDKSNHSLPYDLSLLDQLSSLTRFCSISPFSTQLISPPRLKVYVTSITHEMAPRSDEAEWFFNAVYSAIQEVPRGKVTSYAHIARLLGKRTWHPSYSTSTWIGLILRTL